MNILVFKLDEQHYALRLSAVERIIHLVQITALPGAPDIVIGAINVQGQIVPVVNMRRRFGLAEREPSLGDQLIVARTARRAVALMADMVIGVVERLEAEMTTADTIVPGLEYIEGVAKLKGGLILIHNLDTFLSLDEEKTLEEALTPTGGGG
jgi:purine-binding chemotaxis protein CheW